MDSTLKKRWISLYVENDVGVLAKISGLFSGKSYNLKSLTVGETEDPTVSRMTISLTGDDKTFEQIKKQLNRSVEVIKVLDFTDLALAGGDHAGHRRCDARLHREFHDADPVHSGEREHRIGKRRHT